MTTPTNKMINNNESEDKSSLNMNNTENNTLKNFPSSSIFNGMKSDKQLITNLKSNADVRKFYSNSNSFYNDKPQNFHMKTNSIHNFNNMTRKTNVLNNGYGILNLKQGFNMNLNNMHFNNNKNYAINQSYDFHYNTLGLQNMNYYNNQYPINNNNTQIFSNINQMNNNIFNPININNELQSHQFENNFNFKQNNFINTNPKTNIFNYNNFSQ